MLTNEIEKYFTKNENHNKLNIKQLTKLSKCTTDFKLMFSILLVLHMVKSSTLLPAA